MSRESGRMLFSLVLFLWLFLDCVSAGSSLASVRKRQLDASNIFEKRDVNPEKLYRARNISVPVDHFHNDSMYEPHSNAKFNLRYWFDASHYREGGPVFVLGAGETDATSRLPFLQKGIISILSKATGGIGVILEHRYYGTSQPFNDLSTKHLRFLTTDQALADTAFFARNVVYKGLEDRNLTSHTTPYIAYGGSYAGAFVAILRKLYPDVYYGAISSSGVTEAIYDYWRYYEPIAKYAPNRCVNVTKDITHAMDNIFMKPANKQLRPALKRAFGLQNVTHADDFQYTLSEFGILGWQSKNWDPEVNVPATQEFCGNVSSNTLLYPRQADKKPIVQKILTAGGYGSKAQLARLTTPMLNYIGWAHDSVVSQCDTPKESQDECFGTHDPKPYRQNGLDRVDYRSWPYQYCTQWGFLQTGSGAPKNEIPLVSRLITLNYSSIICRESFNITTPPNVQAINKHGGYNISYPRLAIVDGEWDPWKEATPHAGLAPKRKSTPSEPYYLIPKAVHHWDENGLFANETTKALPPPRIKKVQALEVEWVKGWLEKRESRMELS